MKTSKRKIKYASEMFRGAKMGAESIKTLIPKTKNTNLKKELTNQLEEYSKIEREFFQFLMSKNIKPKDINPFQIAASWLTIQMETLFNQKPNKIATILIKGNNMGVIGITKVLNKNTEKDEDLINFGLKFINLIESNTEKLKPYL